MFKNLFKKHHKHSFLSHFLRNLILGLPALIIVLILGMVGLRFFEQMNWIDSYTNAAMIVSGVGLLTDPQTEKGKLFIATYSVFGGGSFLIIVAVVFAPIFHWLFRQVKIEDREHFKD